MGDQLPDVNAVNGLRAGLVFVENNLAHSNRMELGDVNLLMEESRDAKEAVRLLAERLACDYSNLIADVQNGESESWEALLTKLKLELVKRLPKGATAEVVTGLEMPDGGLTTNLAEPSDAAVTKATSAQQRPGRPRKTDPMQSEIVSAWRS